MLLSFEFAEMRLHGTEDACGVADDDVDEAGDFLQKCHDALQDKLQVEHRETSFHK